MDNLAEPIILRKIPTVDVDRGYTVMPDNWTYDPKEQSSNLIHMGESHPTTMSSCSGILSTDETEADDEGKD